MAIEFKVEYVFVDGARRDVNATVRADVLPQRGDEISFDNMGEMGRVSEIVWHVNEAGTATPWLVLKDT